MNIFSNKTTKNIDVNFIEIKNNINKKYIYNGSNNIY